MAVETLNSARQPNRPPTSREVNEAIELLRDAKADAQAVRLLDIWNAHRLVDAAQQAGTNEELRNLFNGLRPMTRAQSAGLTRLALAHGVKDEGAWS